MTRNTIAVLFLSAVLLLSGCGPAQIDNEPAAAAVRSTVSSRINEPEYSEVEEVIWEYNTSRVAAAVKAKPVNDSCSCLSVARCIYSFGESYIVYPQVQSGGAAQIINDRICSEVQSQAERLGIPVFTEYRVEYNKNGIFSIRIFLYGLYDESGAMLDSMPLTFNSETGELCSISDFFHDDSSRWRGLIPDIITAQANDSQMVLLNDLLPISDDRKFYITEEAVVIMYDLYEISVYEAGEPEFEIMVDDIAECIDDQSMLNVLIEPTPMPTEQFAAEAGHAPAGADQLLSEATAASAEGETSVPESIAGKDEHKPLDYEKAGAAPAPSPTPAQGMEAVSEMQTAYNENGGNK